MPYASAALSQRTCPSIPEPTHSRTFTFALELSLEETKSLRRSKERMKASIVFGLFLIVLMAIVSLGQDPIVFVADRSAVRDLSLVFDLFYLWMILSYSLYMFL